jgi:HAD superfamily hydrolase (TIGR01490 family)
MTATKPIIAAFDFDGTISYNDVLIYFLYYTHGKVQATLKLVPLIPTFVAFLTGAMSRQSAKEKVLSHFFRGKTLEQMQQWGIGFAKEKLPHLVRPSAFARIQWHQKRGDRCVIISATLDLFLQPWANTLGIEDVISSRLEMCSEGRVTGRLLGKNCWGDEKIRRLQEVLKIDRSDYILYAYGDSRGDLPLLAYADYPFYKKMPTEE